MRSLSDQYQANDPNLAPFYSGRPEEFLDRAAKRPLWNDAARCAINTQYFPETQFAGNESVIITGQQAGLFTGPLYTIYKAIGAIRLARQAELETGAPCVPVFWVGADDHDLEEAGTAHFLTKNHECHTLRYQPDQAVDGFPMYRVPLDDSLHDAIDDLAQRLPGSEYRDDIREMLHQTLRNAASMAGWFAALLETLFQGTGLRVFMPQALEIRRAAAWIIEKEIQDPLITTRLLNESGKALNALGFEAQIVKADNECSFFLEMGERRRKVLFENGEFFLPQESIACSKQALLTLLRAAPERFSPNVALRCIFQQALFPAAAYVAGPGEIAYWAQLKPLFDWFELPMPVVYPRPRCLLTTPKLNKLRHQLAIQTADLARPPDDLLEKVLRESANDPALKILNAYRAEYANLGLRFLEEMHRLPAIKPDLREMTSKCADQMETVFNRLAQAFLRADTGRTAALQNQIARLQTALMPGRKPQERTYSIFSFLFEHGPELIPRLLHAVDPMPQDIQEIEL